jgi:hypothetical protein
VAGTMTNQREDWSGVQNVVQFASSF